MADDNNAEDAAERSGELIRREEPPTPGPPRTAKGRTIDRLLSKLSIWPFRNRLFTKSLETAQEVLEKQTKLEETIIQHGRTRGRLNDLEITLAQDRLQRRREFIEERSRLSTALNESMLEGEMIDQKNKLRKGEVKMQQEEQQIQKMEQEMRKLRVKKELEELKKPPAPPPEPEEEPTGRGPSEKQKLRERAFAKRDREIKRIEKLKRVTAETKEALKRTAENELEEELRKIDEMP